ncbi:MAG: recombinase XerD [Acidobacteria bacterium]|nr:MAG: recombinase XerD [Acidobacteriota bacterium]
MTKNRTTQKFNFTKRVLESKPAPTGRQPAYYHDEVARGLCLSVTPKGKKTFFLYRKIEGRPERIRIGPFPDVTVEQARGRTEALNSDIAKGLNPARARRTLVHNPTLQELFDTYLKEHVEVRNKCPRNPRWFFKACLSPLKDRKLHEIQRSDVERLQHAIERQRGPYTSNRAMQLLRSLFNWASAREAFVGPNPVLGIRLFPERKRDRFIQAEEMLPFLKAVKNERSRDLRDLIYLALYTGARRGNVLAMRWEQVDLENAMWTIPEGEAKAGEAIHVPLMPFAIEMLKKRQAKDGKSEFVFPGRGKTGHLIDPKERWARLRKRAGLSDLRFHDLRRTMGSWMAGKGFSLPVIGKTLGHRSLAATQIYARLEESPVRAAMETATKAMRAGRLGSGRPGRT